MTRYFIFFLATFLVTAISPDSVGAGQHMKDMKMGAFEQTVDGTRIHMHLEPAHPMAKMKTKAEIAFTDAHSSKPVKMEDVKVRWAMPEMGHDIETKKAVPARGDGNFTSTVTLPMEGKYTATISAKRDGKPVEVTFSLHAMGGKSNGGGHMH